MNEQIEDERGLMNKEDFKKMLFTAFARMDLEMKQQIFDLIIPIIQVDEHDVSIAQVSQFIDFFNYAPLMIGAVKHKN